VVSRGRRRLAGSERSYLEIELIAGGLKIMVPCQSANAVGLRAVVSPGQLAQITAVLEGDPGALQGTWSWREPQYREKLKSGDVLALAAVLRDLAAQPRLTAREDQLHDRLRALLASELACALQIDITQAGTYIDQHVARARRSQATPTATGP
jgi:CarD family transcriptional regulator